MDESADRGPLDALATWMLARAAARSHRILQARLREAGVTGYEYRILAALADSSAVDGVSQREIGRLAALDRRDVTHTVRALEERGLLERRRDDADERVMRVGLTAQGLGYAREVDAVMAQIQREVLAPLSPAQHVALHDALSLLAQDEGQ